MKSLLIISAALLASTIAAQAESFTFSGKTTPGMQIAGPGPMGKPLIAGSSKGEGELVYASGRKVKATNDCMAWSAPPTSGFTVQGICASVDSDGSKSSIIFSCLALDDKNTKSDCWGRVTGQSGKLQGKTATVSWRGTVNADGKGSTYAGAGEQN